jgi:hypothetical protein
MITMALGSDPRSGTMIDGRYSETSTAWNTVASYDDYAGAQAAVDRLSDDGFPVDELSIVGSDLRLVERVTGRMTKAKAALSGAASGAWFGLFVGVLLSLFTQGNGALGVIVSTMVIGAGFGVIWALIGYLATRGQRDFSSVRAVVATRYEVLVEHKLLARAQELLAQLPGGRPNPFA